MDHNSDRLLLVRASISMARSRINAGMGGASQELKGSTMAGGRSALRAFDAHCEWTGASADDRENWLMARRAGIGGSDAAAIMGVDEWRSELAVYVDKTADGAPTEEESEIADWGRIFEPVILKRFAEKTGRRIVRGGRLMRSKRAPHHLITLDGVQLSKPPVGCRGPGIAEVKTTGYGDAYAEDLPVRVQVQIQWQLFVTGAEWATCIWLPFPERKMQWLDVLPHREFQQVLAERIDAFWQRVQTRTPPAPDGSESSMLALRRLYPHENGDAIRVRGELPCALADEYERNKAALELLQNRQGLIKNMLAATMRESKYALLDDGRYWGSAFYRDRETRCRHCSEVLAKIGSYRTYTLRDAPKDAKKAAKKFRVVDERQLVENIGIDEELAKQLSESLVGAPPASNDEAADVGAAE
jgi:putative phage-type endonuclease